MAALIAVDQLSKNFVPEEFIVKNSGLPFGISSPEFFSFLVTGILCAMFLILYWRFFRAINSGFILITAGALSNLIDRAQYGYVRDFISLGFTTFNPADVMIWTGIIFLFVKHVKKSL